MNEIPHPKIEIAEIPPIEEKKDQTGVKNIVDKAIRIHKRRESGEVHDAEEGVQTRETEEAMGTIHKAIEKRLAEAEQEKNKESSEQIEVPLDLQVNDVIISKSGTMREVLDIDMENKQVKFRRTGKSGSSKIQRLSFGYIENEQRKIEKIITTDDPEYKEKLKAIYSKRTEQPIPNQGDDEQHIETERDEYFDDAVDAIFTAGEASTFVLEQYLTRQGFITVQNSRARLLLNQMEQAGIVAAADPGEATRKILISKAVWENSKLPSLGDDHDKTQPTVRLHESATYAPKEDLQQNEQEEEFKNDIKNVTTGEGEGRIEGYTPGQNDKLESVERLSDEQHSQAEGYDLIRKEIQLERALNYYQELRNNSTELDSSSDLEKVEKLLNEIGISQEDFLDLVRDRTIISESTADAEVFNFFQNEFNLSSEDLQNIDGFNDLSTGQKLLLLENMRQITLGRVENIGAERFKKDMSLYGFFQKIWKGMTKYKQIAQYKQEAYSEVKRGGLSVHGSVIQQLVQGMREFGFDAKVKGDGKLEIQFALNRDDTNEGEQKAIDNFNHIANLWSRVPYESLLNSVNPQKKYKVGKEQICYADYEKAKEDLLNIQFREHRTDGLEAIDAGRTSEQDLFFMDRAIQYNQFLNSNPDVEKELRNIESKSAWRQAMKDTFTERGAYFGAGFLSRSVTASLLGAVAVPFAAGGVAAVSSALREKKALRERTTQQRRGSGEGNVYTEDGQVKKREANKELYEFVNAKNLTKRLTDFVTYLQADRAPEQIIETKKSLEDRINYTLNKIDEGLVDYGSDYERISNHYDLMQGLATAIQYTEKSQVSEELDIDNELVSADNGRQQTTEERLQRFLERKYAAVKGEQKKKIIKSMGKGFLLGASFSTLGRLVREGTHLGYEYLMDKYAHTPSAPAAMNYSGANSGINFEHVQAPIPELERAFEAATGGDEKVESGLKLIDAYLAHYKKDGAGRSDGVLAKLKGAVITDKSLAAQLENVKDSLESGDSPEKVRQIITANETISGAAGQVQVDKKITLSEPQAQNISKPATNPKITPNRSIPPSRSTPVPQQYAQTGVDNKGIIDENAGEYKPDISSISPEYYEAVHDYDSTAKQAEILLNGKASNVTDLQEAKVSLESLHKQILATNPDYDQTGHQDLMSRIDSYMAAHGGTTEHDIESFGTTKGTVSAIESSVKKNVENWELYKEGYVEHLDYKGGTSVWQEAKRQLEQRFAGVWKNLGGSDSEAAEALKTYNIDRVKILIENNKAEYGFTGKDLDHVTEDQLKNIKWDKVFEDINKKGLTQDLSPEKIKSIVKNNDTLNEYFSKHPDIKPTTENVEAVLHGKGGSLLERPKLVSAGEVVELKPEVATIKINGADVNIEPHDVGLDNFENSEIAPVNYEFKGGDIQNQFSHGEQLMRVSSGGETHYALIDIDSDHTAHMIDSDFLPADSVKEFGLDTPAGFVDDRGMGYVHNQIDQYGVNVEQARSIGQTEPFEYMRQAGLKDHSPLVNGQLETMLKNGITSEQASAVQQLAESAKVDIKIAAENYRLVEHSNLNEAQKENILKTIGNSQDEQARIALVGEKGGEVTTKLAGSEETKRLDIHYKNVNGEATDLLLYGDKVMAVQAGKQVGEQLYDNLAKGGLKTYLEHPEKLIERTATADDYKLPLKSPPKPIR